MKKLLLILASIAVTAAVFAGNSGKIHGFHQHRRLQAIPTTGGVIINSTGAGRSAGVAQTLRTNWAVPTTSGVFINSTTTAAQAGEAVPTVSTISGVTIN